MVSTPSARRPGDRSFESAKTTALNGALYLQHDGVRARGQFWWEQERQYAAVWAAMEWMAVAQKALGMAFKGRRPPSHAGYNAMTRVQQQLYEQPPCSHRRKRAICSRRVSFFRLKSPSRPRTAVANKKSLPRCSSMDTSVFFYRVCIQLLQCRGFGGYSPATQSLCGRRRSISRWASASALFDKRSAHGIRAHPFSSSYLAINPGIQAYRKLNHEESRRRNEAVEAGLGRKRAFTYLSRIYAKGTRSQYA
jgi:hypothetical protein